MNVFNRIVVVLLLLFLIVLSIVSVVNVFADLFKWSDIANRILSSTSNVNVYIAALIFLLLLAVSISLIIAEFYRRKTKTAHLSAVKSGAAMVDLNSASRQITEELLKVEDISEVRVKVVPKSDGVVVNAYAKLVKGLNVSEKMQEVIDKASKFSSENLGFRVIKTNFTAVGFTPERVEIAENFKKLSEESPNKDKEEKKEGGVPVTAAQTTYPVIKVDTDLETTAMEETTAQESPVKIAAEPVPMLQITSAKETNQQPYRW